MFIFESYKTLFYWLCNHEGTSLYLSISPQNCILNLSYTKLHFLRIKQVLTQILDNKYLIIKNHRSDF